MALANEYMLEELTAEEIYQKKLTAGTNITIDNQNVISATGGGSSVQYTSNYAQGDILGILNIDGASSAIRTPNLVEGENITITRNQQAGTVTISSSAGSGDLSAHELTEEAYNVLTPAEKTNGELYLTHPATVGSSEPNKIYYNDTLYGTEGGNANRLILDAQIYSTDEKQVGVWLNGKPIYEKTYELQTAITVSYNSWSSSGISTSGIEQLINVITYYNATCWGGSILTTIDQGDFHFQTARNGASCSLNKFVVQYTKSADSAGSGGYQAYGFSPIIYSEEEREVGVYKDNKPLYQKTLTITKTSTATLTDISYLNIDNFVYSTGVEFDDNKTFVLTLNYHENTNWYCFIEKVGDNLGIYCSNQDYNSARNVIVTIQYTKTTDVAGSGSYNTLGVPTVHYDASEQVIGTFLGKTLYQKIFDWSSSPVNIPSTWSVTTIDSSNIERVIECKGHHSDGTFYTTDADPTGNSHTKLKMRNNGGGGTYSYVTLQYTKIND